MIVEFVDENGNVEVGTITRFLDSATSLVGSETTYEGNLVVEAILPCNFKPKIMRLPNGAEYYVVIDSIRYYEATCVMRLRGEPNNATWW